LLVGAAAARAQEPASEAIQRQRDEAERQKAEYLEEKARVDHINARVQEYKDAMARIPFEPVPNTSNLIQVFMNGHDLQQVARQIYALADDGSESGFSGSYWPIVVYLNRAKDYHTGMPSYGKLDPQSPENNVALFPNIRKQGYKAVVAQVAAEDSVLSQQLTAPVVLAYQKRLAEEVTQLASRGGEVRLPAAPASMPGVNNQPLFKGLPTEPRSEYPARRVTTASALVSTDPVPVDRSVPLDPAPPAWSLRQGVNMLGPDYQGYNLGPSSNKFELAPEFAPIAFLGGRDPLGNPHTQPGMHFGLNQRFFGFLLTNESAFVAFAAGDAPSMNGGSLNIGLDIDLGVFNLAALAGMAGLNVIGDFETGPAFTGRVRVPLGTNVYVLGLGTYTNISHFRVEDASGGRTGVENASYFGLGVVLR
jgi:hypothetical protein